MTIDEVIRKKEGHLQNNAPFDDEELEKADRMSIEALRRLAEEKAKIPTSLWNPLPGETEG